MGKVIKELEEAQGCIICGQTKEHGIMIISEFICEDCEHEMVQTDVMDAKYPFLSAK